MPQGELTRATIFVRGDVQGVGFRWWTRARALEFGLVGHARNTPDGRVEVVAQGPAEAVDRLAQLLGEQPSRARRPGSVAGLEVTHDVPRDGITGFAAR